MRCLQLLVSPQCEKEQGHTINAKKAAPPPHYILASLAYRPQNHLAQLRYRISAASRDLSTHRTPKPHRKNSYQCGAAFCRPSRVCGGNKEVELSVVQVQLPPQPVVFTLSQYRRVSQRPVRHSLPPAVHRSGPPRCRSGTRIFNFYRTRHTS